MVTCLACGWRVTLIRGEPMCGCTSQVGPGRVQLRTTRGTVVLDANALAPEELRAALEMAEQGET